MITETQAANVLKYLVAAGAMNAVEDQHVVWADYINHEYPETQPSDLLPAARTCLTAWSSGTTGWKVDLPQYAKAIRRLRHDRVEQALAGKPLLPEGELDPSEYLEWVREARRAVGDGASRQQASDHAWNHIGKPPPKPGQPAILQRKQGILDLEKVPRDDGNRPGV